MGDVAGLLDPKGTLVGTYEYDPYGKLIKINKNNHLASFHHRLPLQAFASSFQGSDTYNISCNVRVKIYVWAADAVLRRPFSSRYDTWKTQLNRDAGTWM